MFLNSLKYFLFFLWISVNLSNQNHDRSIIHLCSDHWIHPSHLSHVHEFGKQLCMILDDQIQLTV